MLVAIMLLCNGADHRRSAIYLPMNFPDIALHGLSLWGLIAMRPLVERAAFGRALVWAGVGWMAFTCRGVFVGPPRGWTEHAAAALVSAGLYFGVVGGYYWHHRRKHRRVLSDRR